MHMSSQVVTYLNISPAQRTKTHTIIQQTSKYHPWYISSINKNTTEPSLSPSDLFFFRIPPIWGKSIVFASKDLTSILSLSCATCKIPSTVRPRASLFLPRMTQGHPNCASEEGRTHLHTAKSKYESFLSSFLHLTSRKLTHSRKKEVSVVITEYRLTCP